MSKLIIIDWGFYIHKAIHSPSEYESAYICCTMLLGDLKKIELDRHDKIIIACDSYFAKNFRKIMYPQYKADRKEAREKCDIDWEYEYQEMNKLRDALQLSTPFHFISVNTFIDEMPVGTEADDIIAVTVRKYPDTEVHILSVDTDLEQLCIYDNCKIFSPISKRYKEILNPHKVLIKKILGKEISDNLRNKVTNEIDYEIRKNLVSLIDLPIEVEESISNALDYLEEEKEFDVEFFPYDEIAYRLDNIYNNEGSITFEKSLKIIEEKKRQEKIAKEIKKQGILFNN